MIDKLLNQIKNFFKGTTMNPLRERILQKTNQPIIQPQEQITQPTKPMNTNKIVFATKFGSGVVLSDPKMYGTARNYFQFFSGKDVQTGFDMADVSNFFGPNSNLKVQSIPDLDLTEATIRDYLDSRIVSAIGPIGKSISVLRNTSKKRFGKAGDKPAPQIEFMLERNSNDKAAPLPLNEWYYSLYFKLDANLFDRLIYPSVGEGASNWYSLAEFKTGGYDAVNSHGDYRLIVTIKKEKDGLVFKMAGDNAANGLGFVPGIDAYNIPTPYWEQSTKPGLIKPGIWCKLEMYVKRPSSKDDLVNGISWAAITPIGIKQRIVIGHKVGGLQMGLANLPLSRLFFQPNYSGGNPPIVTDITDLEIWNGLPFDQSLLSVNNVMYDSVIS